MKSRLSLVTQAWDQFWFSKVSLLNLAYFRILLTGTMGLLYLGRQWDLDLYYTEKGLLPKELALKIIPDFYRPFFSWSIWNDNLIPYIHLFLVVGLFLLAFGVGGRLLNLVVWLLHIAFLQRNYALAFGADLIGGIFLFLMIGTQSCARLSLKNIWTKKFSNRNSESDTQSDLFSSAFYRMIQIQLAVVYVYTGFEKLKGASWWDGTAVWSVFANPQMVIADLSWLRHFSWFIVLVTYSTLIFEIYFPAFVLNTKSRKWALLWGVFFHLGIGAVMALWSFAIIMLAPYFLFLTSDESKKVLSFFKTKFNKTSPL